MEEGGVVVENKEKHRDIRRFYCGICRSKKSLIASHLQTHHKEEIENKGIDEKEEAKPNNSTCEECGASFKKPAHLKQHTQSHSLEHWNSSINSKMQGELDWTSSRLGDHL
ncbi:hypothetical protein MKX01_037878 [Papaver californicum]|nr:hypothetical protein MKX01_037878 [Papaver californicum]